MLDDYEVEQREDPEVAEDIRVLGAVTYTGMEHSLLCNFYLSLLINPLLFKPGLRP